jgi:hypothetical protein
LSHRKDFSTFEFVLFAPYINPFFRPEEKHARSGEDQVIIPAGEGQGEVDKQVAI